MVVLAPPRGRQDVGDVRGVPLKKLLQSSNITPISPTVPTAMATQERQGGLLEARKVKTKPPPLFKVLLLNDDYTPMDFVVDVLMRFFPLDLERATQVMLHVHTRGRGVCGVFTREIAESKVAQVNEYSRLNQHPLLCTMEKA